MTFLVVLVLAVLAFGFVLYPFFVAPARRSGGKRVVQSSTLEIKRDKIIEALNDLELDFQSGGLSDVDYQKLKREHDDKLDALLKETTGSKKRSVEEDIERRVLEMRKKKGKGSGQGLRCYKCRARLREGDRFCPQCGTDFHIKN